MGAVVEDRLQAEGVTLALLLGLGQLEHLNGTRRNAPIWLAQGRGDEARLCYGPYFTVEAGVMYWVEGGIKC